MDEQEFEVDDRGLDTQDTQEIIKIRKMNKGKHIYDLVCWILAGLVFLTSSVLFFIFGKEFFYLGFVSLALMAAEIIACIIFYKRRS